MITRSWISSSLTTSWAVEAVDAVVAGHLCLDIIPDLSRLAGGQFDSTFRPGRLVQAGPATITTGGAEAPSVGSVPAEVAGRSSLELKFNIQVLEGSSPAQSVLRASATGAYDDGMSWQAYAELAVPYP